MNGGSFGTPVKVERIKTGAGDWLPSPLTGLWGKVGKGLMETQWRSMDDVQADRQFNGSSEQISRPHTNQTRVHCYWPARTARPQSLPTLNGLVEKESHKLWDEQRGRLCIPLLSHPPLSHAISFFPLPSSGFHLTKPFSPWMFKKMKG